MLCIAGLELVADGEGFTVGAVVSRERYVYKSTLVVAWLAVSLEIVSFKVLISDCLLLSLRLLQSCRRTLIETIDQIFLPLYLHYSLFAIHF